MSAEPIVIVDSDEEAAQPSTSAALASSDQKDVATVVPQAAAPVDDEKGTTPSTNAVFQFAHLPINISVFLSRTNGVSDLSADVHPSGSAAVRPHLLLSLREGK